MANAGESLWPSDCRTPAFKPFLHLPDCPTAQLCACSQPVMSVPQPVILFYKYVPISDPALFADQQRALCVQLGIKGRYLIASEGVNGTLAGAQAAIDQFVDALRSDPRFSDIAIKVSDGDEATFGKLIVRVRPEIVTLAAGVPLTPETHNQLTPAEWKHQLEQDPEAIVLDVRNNYEAAAGHFEGAVICDIEHFRDLPAYVDQLEPLKGKNVLMYCTGGIRCEKASALLRSRGFENLFQLHGGILEYQKEFGNEHWLGECFVFDKRMTVRVEEALVHVSRCAHSGQPSARFVNCLHDHCHRLFVLSEQAEAQIPDHRLCPECLAAGLTSETAAYKRV